MDIKGRIIRYLSQLTCDKTNLNKQILKLKKCFAEADSALCGKKKK